MSLVMRRAAFAEIGRCAEVYQMLVAAVAQMDSLPPRTWEWDSPSQGKVEIECTWREQPVLRMKPLGAVETGREVPKMSSNPTFRTTTYAWVKPGRVDGAPVVKNGEPVMVKERGPAERFYYKLDKVRLPIFDLANKLRGSNVRLMGYTPNEIASLLARIPEWKHEEEERVDAAERAAWQKEVQGKRLKSLDIARTARTNQALAIDMVVDMLRKDPVFQRRMDRVYGARDVTRVRTLRGKPGRKEA